MNGTEMDDQEKQSGMSQLTPTDDDAAGSDSIRSRPQRDNRIEELRARVTELRQRHPTVDQVLEMQRELAHLEALNKEDDDADSDNPLLMRRIKFIERPKVRAYYSGTRLFKSKSDDVDLSTESIGLFTDFLFVGITALAGDVAIDSADSFSYFQFAVAFLASWRLWNFVRDIVSLFEMGALSQRVLILWILICLVGFATNLNPSNQDTPYMFVGFVAAARLVTALAYVVFALFVPRFRAISIWRAIICLLPLSIWIISVLVEVPGRYGLMWTSFILDWLPSHMVHSFAQRSRNRNWKVLKLLKTISHDMPAIDVDRQSDRDNGFVAMVLGNFVVSIIYQNTASLGLNVFFGKSVLSISIAFGLNLLYFDADNHHYVRHALLRSSLYSRMYIISLYLTVAGIAVAGSAVNRVIVAHDVPGSNPLDLDPANIVNSDDPLRATVRWYFGAGLGGALLAMGVIQLAHEGPPRILQEHKVRIARKWRLLYRALVGLSWILIPIAGNSLNSLNLLMVYAITQYSVVLVELYGRSFQGENMFSLQKVSDDDYEEVIGGDERMMRASEHLL